MTTSPPACWRVSACSHRTVRAAGGLRDTQTLRICYRQPDSDTLLAEMSEERKVRDAALAGP